MPAAHVRKGDEVMITAGEFRGQTGEVIKVDPERERVTVRGSGIRPVRKAIKPTRVNPQGGETEVDRTFHKSNVSPVVGGRATRVRFDVREDGSKYRIAARDGSELGRVRGPRSRG